MPSTVSNISDDCHAFTSTKDLHCGTKTTLAGPKVVLYDFVKAKTWDLLTHSGFLTYIHHDANGQMTWTTCRNGAKIWIIVQPKKELLGDNAKDLYKLIDLLIDDYDDLSTLLEKFDFYAILLEPGQVL